MNISGALEAIGIVMLVGIFTFAFGFQTGIRTEKHRAKAAFNATMERINEVGDFPDHDAVLRSLCDAAGLDECPVQRDAP